MQSPSPANKNSIPIQRKAREWALQLLYQLDITNDSLSDALVNSFYAQITILNKKLGEKEKLKIRNIAERIVQGVRQHQSEIDNTLIDISENWTINRMATVDRNILRIAVFEIRYQDNIPAVVSINEAIEIAKLFGGDDSGKFVNGILDKINKSGI